MRNPWRALLGVFVLILAACLVLSGHVGHVGHAQEGVDDQFFIEFLVGKYHVVGRSVDTRAPYAGSVTISRESGVLRMRRDIQGRSTIAGAEVARSRGDGTPMLRVTFEEDGVDYEGSYTWSSDLDNYARISGTIVKSGEKTDNPGLECLFIDHSDP